MRRWDILSLADSSAKQVAREPGPDAPRVASVGRQKPRVLFSSPECRLIALDLLGGEDMDDHQVRERAVVEVVSGRVSVTSGGETFEGGAGTLVTFDPGERHSLRGIDDARLLLVLAPWPAAGHNDPSEPPHDQHLPANASVAPVDSAGDQPSQPSGG